MTPPADETDDRIAAVHAAQQDWYQQVKAMGGPSNTLLWHRELPLGTFDLTVAHPGGVARLLTGSPTRLSGLVREHVAFAEARDRLAAIRGKSIELRREHGMTTSFIAVGMATWSIPKQVLKIPRAPVMLRRCKIHPVDQAGSDYTIQLDQDVVFNPALLHCLEDVYKLQFDPHALTALATANGGFDPRAVYEQLEDICAEVPGFGIGPNLVISNFPWAKLSLAANLFGSPEGLAKHPMIASLAGLDERQRTVDPDDNRANDLANELIVLDADAEQRRAIDVASHGGSILIDTVAGTGATQTITNIVAGALAQSHTALVVSEERPAIDALQRRLAYVGLGEVVLDLPEDPRRARIAIQSLADQLRRSTGAPEPEFPEDPLPTWRQAQARLIEHESQMHTKHAPWDLSLAQTESAVAGLNGLPHPPLSHVRLETSVLKSLTPDRLTQLRETLTEAAQIGVWQRGRMEDPWFGAALQSPEDAERAAAIVKSLVMSDLIQARQEIDQVCKKAGLPAPLNLDQWRARVNLMGRVYETLDVFRAEIYEAPLDDLVRATSDNAADRPGALLRTRLKRQVRGLLRPGVPPADLAVRVKAARDERAEWEELAGRAAPPNTPAQWEQASEQFMPIHRDLVWLAKVLKPTPSGQDVMTTHLDLLLERLLRLDARADRLPVTASAYIMLQPLRDQGLGPLIDDLAKRGITAEDVNAEVDLIFYASLLDYLESADDGSTLSGEDQVDAAKALRRADREQLRRNRARVLRSLHRKLQRVVAKNPSQVKALYAAADAHEHDLRAVLERSPDVVKALRPALVGSPLVVPATIPERFSVKVTIVEHAGRTRTAHCIAAISHGEQTIIAGDSLRPRPMAFHAIVEDILPGDEPLTSLLDDAADLLPTYTFSTHYRAKDQRLVAPLAKIVEKARPGQTLEAHPGVLRSPRANVVVSDSPTGLPEETVEALLRHLSRRPQDSVGILVDGPRFLPALHVALRERLVREGVSHPALAEDADEQFFVVEARRWAGQVRDHIVWVGMPGANSGDGHTVDSEDIVTMLSAARGTVDFVTTDPITSWPRNAGADLLREVFQPRLPGDADAEVPALLADLGKRLAAEGFAVRHAVGDGRYAVPLGIEDPARPGRLLVAVDTDLEPLEATPGRDEFRLRHDQLMRLGWVHTRARSRDLFRDPAREVARLVALVREASNRRPS